MSELSKPVGYVGARDLKELAYGDCGWIKPNDAFGESPVYSQEYVSALIQRAEAAEEEREIFRQRLKLERSCLEDADKRIAELSRLLAHNIERAEEAEKRLATPVRLPRRAPENLASVLDGYENWLIATTFRDTWNACLDEVSRVSSGFTVEGDGQ